MRGRAENGLEVGAVHDKHKMAKHVEIALTPGIDGGGLTYRRRTEAIEAEARRAFVLVACVQGAARPVPPLRIDAAPGPGKETRLCGFGPRLP